MLHIDPATLRRYPIIGVLLGAATALVIGYLVYSGWPEARVLLSQKTPDRVSLHDAVTQRGARWVTISDGQWHCDQAITIERSVGVERWFRGPIESTEVPVTGAIHGDLLVASFDGALKCEERNSESLTGVIGSAQIFTSRAALQRWQAAGHRVNVLNVGASPRWALILLVVLLALAVGGLVLCGYYLRLLFRPSRRPAPQPFAHPIHPS
jgi:hypothetical protein